MRKAIILACTAGYAVTMCLYQVYANRYVDSPVWSAVFFAAYAVYVTPLILVWRNDSTPLSRFERYCLGHFLILFLTVQLYYLICLFSMPIWVYSNNVFFGCFLIFNIAYYVYNAITDL